MRLAILTPWTLFLILLPSICHADFHFLNCVSSKPSSNPNPTIAVPTSDLASCSGILGERMVLLENLTQPVGEAAKFSISDLCGAQRLDFYLPSSKALTIYYAGGDGTQIGACNPTPSRNFSCSSQSLSLDCIDSWTCLSGICEAAREDSVTTSAQSPVITSVSASASGSHTVVLPPNTSIPGVQSSPSSAESSSARFDNSKSSQKTSIIVGAVLGAISLCLALAIVVLVWRRRRKHLEIRTADNTPTESSADAMPEGTIRPFLATQSSLSSTLSPKTPRPASAPWPGSTSPAVREELRQAVREAVREAIPGSRSDDSWHTVHVDALPPLYSRGEVRV